jgi:prepilin-type processing-associated H-X9-DG protein
MNIYRHIDHQQSVYAPANAAVRQMSLAALRCPSEGNDAANNFGTSSYAGSHHDVEAPIDVDNHGVFFLNSRLRDEDVRDGLAHTIFLAEKRIDADDLGWMSGTRATLRNAGTPINGARATTQTPAPNPAASKPADEGAIAPAAPNATPSSEAAQQVAPDYDSETAATEIVTGQDGQPAAIQPIQPPAIVAVDPLYVGGFSSAHPLQANIAFGDGNVRLLSTSMDPLVLQQLAHRDDGKLLNALDR